MRWHPFCNNKIKTRFGAAVDSWLCERCETKRKAAISSSTVSPPLAATPDHYSPIISPTKSLIAKSTVSKPPSSKFREARVANFYPDQLCSKIGCENLISNLRGIDSWKPGFDANSLCKRHEMEEKHKRALAARPDLRHNAGLNATKPINKKKLYPKTAPERQMDMFNTDFETGPYEYQQNVQATSQDNSPMFNTQGSTVSTSRPRTWSTADDRIQSKSCEVIIGSHMVQLDGSTEIQKSPRLQMQMDPEETPPRPKIALPGWQLKIIANNAAQRNAVTQEVDEDEEGFTASVGSPYYKPVLPSKSPTVIPSVGDRDDDHYSPSLQLEGEIGAFAQMDDQVSSGLSSLSSTPLRQTPDAISSQNTPTVQSGAMDMDDPSSTMSLLQGSPTNETDKYKQRHIKVLMGEWGEDFISKLTAWPQPPGKTFLEFLVKICRTEKVSLHDFAQGISLAYHERIAGKDNIRGHDRYIKISDVKVFLSRYHVEQQASTEPADNIASRNEVLSKNYRISIDGAADDYSDPSPTKVKKDMSRAKMPEVTPRRSRPGLTEPIAYVMTDLSAPRVRPDSRSDNCTQRAASAAGVAVEFGGRHENRHVKRKAENHAKSADPAVEIAEQLNGIHENRSAKRNGGVIRPPPPTTTPINHNMSKQNLREDRPVTEFMTLLGTKRPRNLEAKRQLKAAVYDKTTLDSFLLRTKSEDKEPDHEAWGHIDPRKAWPQNDVLTGELLEKKQAEIAARGNRKSASRFGKHLTPEVVQHRKEMGWQLHQNCETKNTISADRHPLGSLFGVPEPDTMEPASKDGKLWMQEIYSWTDGDDQSRRTANRKAGAWPVISAN
ncbi:hypothetical protein PVAG01_03711 [Phlyctema vagabunda]|uniref:Uncharacterized protein n=1 Tax=Phlyctema vagabunda TaxID=108571 RepID=A0ABR4PMA2_9HELO